MFSRLDFNMKWTIRLASLAALALAGTTAFVVFSQVTPPNIPAVNLATDPLFAATGGDKPAIALALSVEFPTVGAQYVDQPNQSTDATYSNVNEYIGYYDAESCYSYNNTPTETPAAGLNTSDYKRFDRTGPALSRQCANAFSGNFLNWSSSSAIDMLRLALSGGDRYIDTATQTILQRAVLPNGDPTCMFNSLNFPAKQLQRNGGGAGTYWGAIPVAMRTQAATSDVWVANTLNRIYFGTSKTGDCDNTKNYTLGGSTVKSYGTIERRSSPLPSDATLCSAENTNCEFTGVKEVWYGARNSWRVVPAQGGIACNNTTFGDPIGGTLKSCYTRTYSGSWQPQGTGLNSDGYFYSRVQVCNAAGATLQDDRDYGLCKQQPNGNYKPTGSIQKYSDQLRLSAFGYAIDQGSRYGGVLRAPMKYVGARTFNEDGIDNTPASGNPASEWDASTGVFTANPDADTTQTKPISGVINYLNKFGRTGPVLGRYKKFDPVGELYGEALRYLQGLGPTSSAVAGLTPAMYDGFPIATTWSDPYGGTRSPTADYACLKSNIVTIGDVRSADSDVLYTRATDLSNNLPDFKKAQITVKQFESNTASTYIDGLGETQTTSNPNTANYSDQTSFGTVVPNIGNATPIIGQAYWAHTNDIRGKKWTAEPTKQRPGLRLKSYFFDVNEGASSNGASFRRTQNQFFTAAKYGGFESDPANSGGKPYNTYGNPFKQQDGTNNNDVWQSPTNPGEASTYYLQSSARGVLTAFDSIFSRATSSARSIAGVAVANKNFTQPGNTIYQGSFDTADWSGDVLAIPVSVNASNTVAIDAVPVPTWTAATRLGLLTNPQTSRKIFVGRSGATLSPAATAFKWPNIDSALQTELSKSSPSAATDTLGEDRLNFIRGDKSKEGAPFRTRSKLLGDIINSGITYSGSPTLSINGPGYASFASTANSRTPALFVGANDGMMHAFDATNGDELFAYIPSWMGRKLSALTSTSYNANHQTYVDATPYISEAQVGSDGTAADWKTVLVSGTGGGGEGVFALDVTNPSAFSASNVMWEFTKADDADMGFVLGKPQIMKLRTSDPGATVVTYRWFALVASGVNNYVPNAAGAFSTTGKPALFLLALDKAAGTAWSASGDTPNYYKISLPISSTLSATRATGVINFQTTFGLQRELAEVYMGDLHGNMWKLDFSLHGKSQWNMLQLTAYSKLVAGSLTPYPLYIAKTSAASTSTVQPITMTPKIVSGPLVDGIKTAYVAFGTGKYLEVTDKSSTAKNSFYVIYDNGLSAADSSDSARTSIVSSRARLSAGTINTTTGVITVPPFLWGRSLSDADTTRRSGFYFDFVGSGERLISGGTLVGDSLVFGSLIPNSAGTTGSCSASGGGGNEYTVNVDSGNGSLRSSTVGLLGEPFLADITAATVYSSSDTTGRRTKTTTSQVIQQGSTGVNTSRTITSTFVAGRLSWRQINNYQDLKNK
jgi:type IV pilus assembly protein PilY1